jgi:hypothetical protein
MHFVGIFGGRIMHLCTARQRSLEYTDLPPMSLVT